MKMKKLLATLLTVCMVMSLVPTTSFAYTVEGVSPSVGFKLSQKSYDPITGALVMTYSVSSEDGLPLLSTDTVISFDNTKLVLANSENIDDQLEGTAGDKIETDAPFTVLIKSGKNAFALQAPHIIKGATGTRSAAYIFMFNTSGSAQVTPGTYVDCADITFFVKGKPADLSAFDAGTIKFADHTNSADAVPMEIEHENKNAYGARYTDNIDTSEHPEKNNIKVALPMEKAEIKSPVQSYTVEYTGVENKDDISDEIKTPDGGTELAPPVDVTDVDNNTDNDGTTSEKAYSYQYNGLPRSFTGDITFGDYAANELVKKYSGAGNTTYDSATAPKDVGTYKYVVSVPETDMTYSGSVEYLFNITAAPLTFIADSLTFAEKEYDATTEVGPTVAMGHANFTGWKNNEAPEVISATYSVVDANVAADKVVTAVVVAPTNYSLANADELVVGKISITPYQLTAPTGITGVAGQTLAKITVPTSIKGVKDEDVEGTFAWDAPATAIVKGTQTVKFGFTTANTNYKSIPTNTDITITGIERTAVTFSGITAKTNIVYTKKPAIAIDGTLTASAGYDMADVSKLYVNDGGEKYSSETAPTNAGNYKYVVSVPDSNDTYTGKLEVPFTIAPKALTVTAENKTKVYDGAIFATASYTAVVSGTIEDDAVPTIDKAITFEGTAIEVTDVGTYVITPVIAADAVSSDDNYTVTGATIANGELEITKAAAPTIVATTESKVYNGAAQTPTVTLNGLATGFTVKYYSDETRQTEVTAENVKNAGIYYYTVTQTDTVNYENASSSNAVLTITPKALTLTALAATATNRTYNGTKTVVISNIVPTPAIDTDLGVIGTDEVTLVTTDVTGTMADENVGNEKTVTVSASDIKLGGAQGGNYSLVLTGIGAITTTVDITKAPLKLTFAGTKVYNEEYSVLSYDDLTVVAEEGNNFFETELSGIFTGAETVIASDGCAKTADANADGYDVKAAIAGMQAANYAITIKGKLIVTPAEILIDNITASPLTKEYDETTGEPANFALSIAASALYNSDVVTVAGTAAYAAVGAGTQGNKIAVTGMTLGGADAGNYTLSADAKDFDATITKSTDNPAIPEQNDNLATQGDVDGNTNANVELIVGSPLIESVTADTITVKTITVAGKTVEYGYKTAAATDITWQTSPIITGLEMGTVYNVYARVAGDDNTEPSAATAATTVTTIAGVEVKGKVKTYNAKNTTTITLTGTGANTGTNYTVDIAALATGSGQVTQEFIFPAVAPGTYTMVVKKAGHTSFTKTTLTVGTVAIDLSSTTESDLTTGVEFDTRINTITLGAGDVNNSGKVDGTDLAILISGNNYDKTSQNNKLTDVNGSGKTDGSDLSLLTSPENYDKPSVTIN